MIAIFQQSRSAFSRQGSIVYREKSKSEFDDQVIIPKSEVEKNGPKSTLRLGCVDISFQPDESADETQEAEIS